MGLTNDFRAVPSADHGEQMKDFLGTATQLMLCFISNVHMEQMLFSAVYHPGAPRTEEKGEVDPAASVHYLLTKI